MKTVIVLRHAKSDWSDAALRDFDRGLNGRGERAAAVMGQWAAGHGVTFETIIASPAVRVTQTLARFRDAYGPCPEPMRDMRLYLASAGTIAEVLSETAPDRASVLLAAHSPGLEDFILTASGQERLTGLRASVETKFPTAAMAVLTFYVADWADLASGFADAATLEAFVRPRDLDPSLGPDQR